MGLTLLTHTAFTSASKAVKSTWAYNAGAAGTVGSQHSFSSGSAHQGRLVHNIMQDSEQADFYLSIIDEETGIRGFWFLEAGYKERSRLTE